MLNTYLFDRGPRGISKVNHKKISLFLSGPTTKSGPFLYIFTYFSPKIVEKIFFGQNPFPAILRRKNKNRKKVPMTTEPRGLRP